MNIQPIQKINAVEQVFEQMQNLLIEGTWRSGDKLPSENELSETFGVSRMTIRQAMQKLKALGLIETRTGSGSYVREVSPEDSLNDLIPLMYIGKPSQMHVFQFREMIDSESVRIATPLMDDRSLDQLEEMLGKMKKAAEEDNGKSFSHYDLKFHTYIVSMSGNPMLIKAYEILLNVLKESMNSVIEKMKYKPALDYHKKILDAMKKKDADLAEKTMREHIRQNYAYFK
ncbi:MAG: FadR family transcriptional regulator [Lachnospiraceae bacterium]|nr:FadR family transcriptional regulator [Lachnospiraceae bacterium]MBR5943490.1 FadR family transcriptional regulator [Lachnospiraceae bacterium]